MNRSVLILGGGIAGLTAAFRLAADGLAVTIIEESAHLGGGLSQTSSPLLLDAHHATWSLLDQLGKGSLLRRLRHTPLEFLQANGARTQFLHLPLPSPLNTLIGTTLYQGLSMRDRWHLLSFLERTWERDPPLPGDLDRRAADEWLASIGQSESARQGLWNSLARLLLGAALSQASADLFMRTLRRCFLTGARATKLVLPPVRLASLLVTPLAARLEEMGVRVLVNSPTAQVSFERDRVVGVKLADWSTVSADCYISALPRSKLTPLLPERIVTHYAYFQQLGRLLEVPLALVRLHLAQTIEQTQLVLMERRSFHWITRHADNERQEDSSVVWATAIDEPSLLALPKEDLVRLALRDAVSAFSWPSAPPLLETEVFQIPQAQLAPRPGAQQCRPLAQSPFANFFVAGDWTDTGWPANLESAVLSGQRAADAALT
ncbi:FAD-dependent oxidoreductase [Nitrospirales bacterium NOB]|nr:FAD-dependent oxidoreductase [Nitrospirales bacterium NOB]